MQDDAYSTFPAVLVNRKLCNHSALLNNIHRVLFNNIKPPLEALVASRGCGCFIMGL